MSQSGDRIRERNAPDSRARRRNILIAAVIFAGAMLFVAGAFYLARGERQFALDQWQTRIRLAASGPMTRTAAWVKQGDRGLAEVASNATVQIYLSELAAAGYDSDAVPNGNTQAVFVRTYLLSAAARGPFASPRGPSAASPAKAGLALFDGQGHRIAASAGYTPPPQLVARLLKDAARDKVQPAVVMTSPEPVILYARAIRPMQDTGTAPPVGYAIGSRLVGSKIVAALHSSLAADGGHVALLASADSHLHILARSGDARNGGSSLLKIHSSVSAERAALSRPGHLVLARDIDGREALLLGAHVAGTPFMLVASVPEERALAGVAQRRRTLLVALLLAILAMIASGIAISRHQSGQAALQLAQARGQRSQIYRGLVEILLEAIDLRDPAAASHSRRVGTLAREITRTLGADEADIETAELSGSLQGASKLFVPDAILKKADSLSEAERREVDEAAQRWLDLIGQISIDFPIAATLKLAHELAHGLEPQREDAAGLRIAYVIAAANAYVALISARTYRPARTPEEAITVLEQAMPSLPPDVLAAMRRILGEPPPAR